MMSFQTHNFETNFGPILAFASEMGIGWLSSISTVILHVVIVLISKCKFKKYMIRHLNVIYYYWYKDSKGLKIKMLGLGTLELLLLNWDLT